MWSPPPLVKMGLGCVMLAAGYMVFAAAIGTVGTPLGAGWLVVVILLLTLAELHLSPITLGTYLRHQYYLAIRNPSKTGL